MTRLTLAITVATLSPLALLGQDALSAPRIGTVLSSDGFLHDIQGIPGACRFVQNADTSHYIAFQVASHGLLMLAATADSIVITGYGTRRFTLTSAPRAVAVSPKGTFFAVATNEALTVYSLTNPDILPKATDLADLAIADGPLSLAVSDNGVVLLADATHVALTGIGVSTAQAPLALSFPRFIPASDAAVAYSSSDSALVLVHTDTLSAERLLAASDGLSTPTGIEFSADGTTAWISQSGTNSVMSYSLETRSATSFDVGSQGALRSIGLPGVFVWNETAILDAQRAAPQVLLVATEVAN